MSQVTAATNDFAAIKAMIGNPHAAGVQLAFGKLQLSQDHAGLVLQAAPKVAKLARFLGRNLAAGHLPAEQFMDAIAIDQSVIDAIVAGGNRSRKLSWFNDLYFMIDKQARRAVQGTFSNVEVFLDPQAAQLLSAKLFLLFSLMGCDERASPDSFVTFHAAVSALLPGASEQSRQALAEIVVDAICEFVENYSKILRERPSNFIWRRAFLSEDSAARIRLQDFREQSLAWDRFERTVPLGCRGLPTLGGFAQPATHLAKRARVQNVDEDDDEDDDDGDEPIAVPPKKKKKKKNGVARRTFTLAGVTYSKAKATAALKAKGFDGRVSCWCVQLASSPNHGTRFDFCPNKGRKGHGSATSAAHAAIEGVTGCGAETKQLLETCRRADFQQG